MDVDEEDDDTFQRPRKVQNHGIEADFDGVDDDDLAVCPFFCRVWYALIEHSRMPSGVLSSMERSPSYQQR